MVKSMKMKMSNCFTVVYNYLQKHYKIPAVWKGLNINDNMDLYVIKQKQFLAKKQHIAFFNSFCTIVKRAKKDDIVLTKFTVGIAVNKFSYWLYDEGTKRIGCEALNKDCIIMRLNEVHNG